MINFLLFSHLCTCVRNPPSQWGPAPTEPQFRYHKEEISAFVHYGMNTYTGKEWGDGTEDENKFKPTALNTDQWVSVFKRAGIKRVIVVGKHHDGFCNWRTKFTNHSVNSSKDFQDISTFLHQSGDVLEELSKSCTKYDIDMGLYLSPWDVNSPYYGDELLYNEYYMNQLDEILNSNKRYGNNGKFVEVWMDGAKGDGAKAQIYWFAKWFELIYRHQPSCAIWSGYGSEVRWIGNEKGVAGIPCWDRMNLTLMKHCTDQLPDCKWQDGNHGEPTGPDWSVGECDVSITSGWFWKEGKIPKTMEELSSIYFTSVGRGQPLLLNVPPNKDGSLPANLVDRLNELKSTIDQTFAVDFARQEGVTFSASNVRGGKESEDFTPANVADGNEDTYWTMDDEYTTGWIEIDFGQLKTFDLISIKEHIMLGQRIARFEVDVHNAKGEWELFYAAETIGYRHLCRNYSVSADKVRVRIIDSQAVPVIQSIGVHKCFGAFALGDTIPDGLIEIPTSEMEKTGIWTEEVGEKGIWTREIGASCSAKFTGSHVYVMGILDPAHGLMEAYIDGKLVDSVDCSATERKTKQILFMTPPELLDEKEEHTIRLVLKTKAIAIRAFYYLNNGGKGIYEIEKLNYEVDEGNKVAIVIKRFGGSKSKTYVTFQTSPGSAVHGKNFEDITTKLEFLQGETSKTVEVQTLHSSEEVGDLDFYAQIVEPTDGSYIGFNTSTTIVIKQQKRKINNQNNNEKEINIMVFNNGDSAEDDIKSNGKKKSSISFILPLTAFVIIGIALIIFALKFSFKESKAINDQMDSNPLIN